MEYYLTRMTNVENTSKISLRTYIAFTTSIFKELANAQQHHVQTCYNEFQPNRKKIGKVQVKIHVRP